MIAMIYEIVIPGEPIAKKRPKFARRGAFVTVYDTQKKESEAIQVYLRSQWHHRPLETPLEIEIVFYMPIPASWSKKRKEAALKEKHVSKIDVDNAIKKYFDDMNEIVYADDRQIYKVTAEKKYDLNPRTEIKIIAFNH
jgi:Holliday junction resolvase RusA-like endonuclease